MKTKKLTFLLALTFLFLGGIMKGYLFGLRPMLACEVKSG